MTPRITLVRAAAADIPLLTALERQPDAHRYLLPDPPAVHAARLAEPDFLYLRILAAGKIAGFVILGFDPDGRSVELRRIVIGRKDRGSGQGAVARLERYCPGELGRSRIWLDVFAENHRARHVYEKLGYTRCGERSHPRGLLLLYEKSCGPTDGEGAAIPEEEG